MTVIFQDGYSLPGGDQPLRNARIGHSLNWVTGATVTGSAPATGYYLNAVLNSLTYEKWKPTAVYCYLYLTFAATTCDYLAIAGHTLAGCTITISGYNGASFVPIVTNKVIANNSPIFLIFVPVSLTGVLIEVNAGPIPEVAVVKVGRALQLERSIFGGHTPIDFSRQTVLRANRSETGEYLGRTKQRSFYSTSFRWDNLTTAWMEANWITLQKAIESEPFFIAWRPLDRQHVGYCQTDQVPVPQNMGVRDLMSVEMAVRGLAYD